MPIVSLAAARAAAEELISERSFTKSFRERPQAILEGQAPPSRRTTFDVFLSHSYQDAKVNAQVILGLKQIIESSGFTCYVDWIDDPLLDRTKVTSDTARKLRSRMQNCKSLLFVTSQNSSSSKWMPWELGFKDGDTATAGGIGRCAILPVLEETGRYLYRGQEYLGVYPYVSTRSTSLVVNSTNSNSSISFIDWLNGSDP